MTSSSEQQAEISGGHGLLTTKPQMPLGEINDILAQRSYRELKIIQRHIRQLQNQNSRLLRLPAKLRNYIFELVIEYHMRCRNHVQIDDDHYLHKRRNTRGWKRYLRCKGRDLSKMPSLLGVCRQVRSESRSLYYSKFITVERYDFETKSWKKVPFDEMVRLLLRPRRRSSFLELPDTKHEAELHMTPQEGYTPPQLYVAYPTPDAPGGRIKILTSYCAFTGVSIPSSTGRKA
ncbi:hypothetical protein LTR37_000498 [Vermiconidia calcicola]|uniref:Uncharacterized protein n=1 Tax=Vermiconidia calcicola TaxID=1690605 RepID=A0ACC3NZ59_9PEZI|nr:hypothetical protein LTR37_000498 [Vermiconidia calcicola]